VVAAAKTASLMAVGVIASIFDSAVLLTLMG